MRLSIDRRRGAAALAAGALAIAVGSSLATGATKESEFGPPPVKCAVSGCYGSDVGPNVMDNAGNGSIDISPHVVEVGGYIGMTTEGNHGDWVREPPGLTAIGPCERHQNVCGYKAIEPTDGWQEYEMRFDLGAREQDYYGVLAGPATILGRVVDQLGNPVPDVEVEAKGPTNEDTRTTLDGRYSMRVIRPGRYTVTAKSGDSRKVKPKSRTLTLAEGGIGKASFQMETRCPGKGGREKPKSGHYGNDLLNIHEDSYLYYSCRSGRVVVQAWWINCEGHTNQVRLGEVMSARVHEEGDGYAFTMPYKPKESLAVAEGRFTSRTTVTWRVHTPRPRDWPVVCSDFSKRFSGKWLMDAEGTDMPDDITVGEPEQPEHPVPFGPIWPSR